MIKYLFPLFLLLTAATLSAQVSVNQDNSAPDPSAMLDVKSTDKGMLIPRMTTAQRTNIVPAATALLVYDTDTNSFWYYNGSVWQELNSGSPTLSEVLSAGNDGNGTGIANLGNVAVNGNITMQDGNQQAGYIMTSDANGTGSWQSLGSLLSPGLTPDFSCMALSGSLGVGTGSAVMEVAGSYAYVLDNNSAELQVIDVSNPAAPTIAGNLVLGSGPVWFAMSGNYAYVIDAISYALIAIDISNPASPVIVGSLGLGAEPFRIAVSGNYAYVTDAFAHALKVIDISNPGSPTLAGSLDLGLGVSLPLVAVSGNYAYISDFATDAFRVVDVSNPASPTLIATLPIGDYHITMAVSGNYAYIPEFTTGILRVIDVSNPTNPTVVANPAISAWPTSIAVSGNYAYIVDQLTDDLKVVNVSNPASPVVAGSLGTGPQPVSVAVSGNFAYVVDYTNHELRVIALSCTLPLAFDPSTGEFANASTDDADADPTNELQTLGLSGATLSISGGNNVDLAGINTDNQTLNLTGTTLGIANGNSVDLAAIDTDTDNQTLGLSGTSLSISGGNSVNLAGINTDNQTLGFSGNNLSISNGNSIALPLGQANTLTDADNDTRILVEASPDEDVIHAYVKNVEGLQLNQNGLIAPGAYNFDGVPPVNGAGVRLMWVPSLVALRVGEVNGAQWNSFNLGHYSSILGGKNNSIPYAGGYGTITGGASNTVSGTAGFIGAGESNLASGEHAGIIGGLFNVASGGTSFIGTGQYNTASGLSSAVVSGESNNATGNASTVAGVGNKAASYGEVALGLFAANYTPASSSAFIASDRIFAIGNGSADNSRSNALTILKSGNVGIGTTTPKQKLHVNGDYYGKGHVWLYANEGDGLSGTAYIQARDESGANGSNIGLRLRTQSAGSIVEAVHLTPTGRVGIGTSTPQALLHVAGTKATANGDGNYFKYTFGNNSPTQDIGSVDQVVGYFDGDLVANEGIISMNVSTWSDARAKHILRRSDSREDLDLLNRIQITDYQWIDRAADQGRVHKKVIAQEVEQVLPDAVSRMRKAIPNVYARAVKVDYNPAAKTLRVYLDKAHDFAAGDKVRVFTDQGDLDETEVLVVSSPTVFSVSCEKEPSSAFVYGKWVDDYRKVDYDAIAMLNVSATQELAKKTEGLQQRVAELEAENAALKAAFEQRLVRLEAALQIQTTEVPQAKTTGSK